MLGFLKRLFGGGEHPTPSATPAAPPAPRQPAPASAAATASDPPPAAASDTPAAAAPATSAAASSDPRPASVGATGTATGATRHLIIGAGPAGIIAAETIRALDPGAAVTVVGDEPEPPYSRMALPYYLIRRIDEQGTHLRKAAGHYDSMGIEVRHGRVAKVSTGERVATLEDGSSLGFDRLLVATGSRPIRPPVSGLDLPGVHSCWTLADGRAIVELAKPGASVVLMGAGFIGSIVLEALALRDVELTVVEMENRMVPRMMDEQCGGLIKAWCEKKGVRVLTSTKVTGVERQEGEQPLHISLDNGEVLRADLLITATGVAPNVECLAGSDVKVDHGILVDEYLQTSNDRVFAAGDVAQGIDFSTGTYSVQAIQPTAADHARMAARNMVSPRSARHQGSVNMNVLDTMGLVSSSFGLWQGVEGGDSAVLSDPERFRYLSLQFQDDILVGANSLGLTQHVGVLRGLIQSRVRLGKWKERLMHDPTEVMPAYLGATQGLS